MDEILVTTSVPLPKVDYPPVKDNRPTVGERNISIFAFERARRMRRSGSPGRGAGHGFKGQPIVEPMSSQGSSKQTARCCAGPPGFAVISIHLLESLDKIRLPAGSKHGSAKPTGNFPALEPHRRSSGKTVDQRETGVAQKMRLNDRQESSAERLSELLAKVRNCSACAHALPLGPRPILQLSTSATILIASQAPGSKVHRTGVPFADASGDRLREWTGLSTDEFYDEATVAIMPMGFCYPGRSGGGDAPPRAECVDLWRNQLLQLLPAVRLTLLVGSYAQQHVLGPGAVTSRVRNFRDYLPRYFVLPHPSWRSRLWEEKNPWFAEEVLPALRSAIAQARTGDERKAARSE